jgi:hypothetical protein
MGAAQPPNPTYSSLLQPLRHLTCRPMTAQVAASKPCITPPLRMRQPSLSSAYAVLQAGGADGAGGAESSRQG